jgi:hypothetical protein
MNPDISRWNPKLRKNLAYAYVWKNPGVVFWAVR